MKETKPANWLLRFGKVVYECRDRVKQELSADDERIIGRYRAEIRSRVKAGRGVIGT